MITSSLPKIVTVRMSKLQLDSGTETFIKHVMYSDGDANSSPMMFRKDLVEILKMLKDAADDDSDMVSAYKDGVALAKYMSTNGISAVWIDDPTQ